MPAPKLSASGPSMPLSYSQATLLKHLPISIPLDPADSESTYHFGLDPEDVKQEGMIYAFNRNLEVSFQTQKLRDGTLVFKECGHQVVTGNDGVLTGSRDAEDIWAYHDNGAPWADRDLADETFDTW
ncbi:hypothetical protein B0H10DRAFT_1953224 [Mycena sp. CBHHK59/15]|nr:hypothetical protein B0H10DRAFT_1953224 [Mycena sp. CBHHK59/15]